MFAGIKRTNLLFCSKAAFNWYEEIKIMFISQTVIHVTCNLVLLLVQLTLKLLISMILSHFVLVF